MAGSINRVELLGNLGKDPEVRRLDSGDPVVSFSLATSERWTVKDTGEKKERTDWHNVVCFNPGLCDVIEKYVKKGSKVFVAGKLQTRKWMDKDGNDRWTTEVVMQRFGGELVLLGDPGSGGGRPAPSEDDYGSTRTRETGDDYRRAKDEPPRDIARQAPPPQPDSGSGRYSSLDDEIPFAPEWRG